MPCALPHPHAARLARVPRRPDRRAFAASVAAATLFTAGLIGLRREGGQTVSGTRPAGGPAPAPSSAMTLPALAEDGPHGGGWRQVTVARPDGSSFTALLFYPADGEGRDAPYDGGGAPYPAIAFGHGFAQTPDRYEGTLRHLATWGYFVIAPESYIYILPAPDHGRFAADLSLALSHLLTAGEGADAWLARQVDQARLGLSGHSMGGGASLLAAATDRRVRAVANLAAAETSPSAIAAMAQVTVPVSLIAGSEDAIVPVAGAGALMYAAGRPPRLLPVIRGGSHCGFQDKPFPIGCDRGSLPAADQLARTRALLTAFFQLNLRGEHATWRQVWGPESLEDPGLDTRADPGLSLAWETAPGGGGSGSSPGQSDVRWFRVTNTGPLANRFRLDLEPAGSPAALSITETARLAPGEAERVRLTLGPAERPDAADGLLLSAAPAADPGTRAYLQLDPGPGPTPTAGGRCYLPRMVSGG